MKTPHPPQRSAVPSDGGAMQCSAARPGAYSAQRTALSCRARFSREPSGSCARPPPRSQGTSQPLAPARARPRAAALAPRPGAAPGQPHRCGRSAAASRRGRNAQRTAPPLSCTAGAVETSLGSRTRSLWTTGRAGCSGIYLPTCSRAVDKLCHLTTAQRLQ